MNQKTIWVVEGATGFSSNTIEYSDHREWLVGYYLTEKEARNAVEFLTRMANVAKVTWKGNFSSNQNLKRKQFMEPYDPNFDEDYCGTNYGCFEIGLGKKFDPNSITDEKVRMLTSVFKTKK